MATRVIPPRILKTFRQKTITTKPLNSAHPTLSATVAPFNFAEKPKPTFQKPTTNDYDSLLNFNDVEKLFSFVPTTRLFLSSAILHASAVESMVDFGMWVMKSKLMEVEPFKGLILTAIKHTFYQHFCAGEDTTTACRTVQLLNDAGLRGMLVYAVEDATDNKGCDRNLQCFLDTIEASRSARPSSVSFNIVKITAICPLRILERVSDLLRWQQKDHSFNLPWKQNSLPIFSDSSPLYHTRKRPEPLTVEEDRDLELGHERLQKLCQKSVEANIPLLVDAEYTSVQPAIDYMTYSSAILHNKDDNPIVYGTLQTYLKDAKERLLLITKAAEKMGIPMGFKLVRGAYMSSETKIANSLGYASPIHNTIEDTHACFNDCTSFMLEKIANGSGGVVLATHNVQSGKLAAAKAYDLGIEKVNHKLEFAQLLGMSEALSFGLSNAGFQVSKYMPFGPVEIVIPYLLRRAEENRGLLSAAKSDRQLMRKELSRRLKGGII
ncbi:Proline dehydrogenase [Quillaja saponaria]|uniref:Proline dehydrogenase n=1 Tax=Quillaja saponaria TaxID=32244 RepID=A0AAD7PXT8_QUISA|nr:Proline dehydrogenase [Quillaja saponaria]